MAQPSVMVGRPSHNQLDSRAQELIGACLDGASVDDYERLSEM